jgi:uncharacterized membrane protein YbhN (UPF0104 family)
MVYLDPSDVAETAANERADPRSTLSARPGASSGEEPVAAQAPSGHGMVRRRIATVLLLGVLISSLLLSVPGLRPVLHQIREIDPLWVIAAVTLEIASCSSFVVVFRLFFDRLPGRDARPLAWANMASGALLPGGGAGGLAIGGWLIHLTGASTSWIVRRSGGLFFLTTALNAVTVIGAGLLLSLGALSPNGFLLTGLPATLVTVATAAVILSARVVERRRSAPRWVIALAGGVSDAESTTFGTPSWRLLGAIGYLGFDMAVLGVALAAVGDPISIPALLLAYNIGYIANAIPIPGGIGVLDAGLTGALVLYGASATHAAAAVLIYHTIALWIPGAGGLLAYIRVRPRFTGPEASEAPISREGLKGQPQ